MTLNSVCTSHVRGATLLHLWFSPVSDCPAVCGRLSSAPLSWIWVITLARGRVQNFVPYRDPTLSLVCVT